jgi:Flp pilus assembly protein TadD
VNDPSPVTSPRRTRSRRAALLVAALLVTGIVWAVGRSIVILRGFKHDSTGRAVRSRDVYADSPYLNARLGVGYVGDAACARCHRKIAEAYNSHSMGRSLAPVGGSDAGPPTGAEAGLPFESQGIWYTVERRGGRMFHKATRHGADGGVLAEIDVEVRFALGSGTHGINFLVERDGFLFQSPIAWFAQPARWGISPGYGDYTTHPDFERGIHADCLFCHTNQVRAVAGTLNRYEPPIFQGYAIGCERCHGPGALHVNQGGSSAESGLNIVNPADLAPALRDSVCQQCHLQGSFRTTRAGREAFDFRPGLPLQRFWAVFERNTGKEDRFEAVGQVEQMESSRCFRESQGQLGCISCHDPHRLPDPKTKIAYYRDRCMECHQTKGCALPTVVRQKREQNDDCVACHMPRLAVQNIPHTAATNHRIPRGITGSVPDRQGEAVGRPRNSLLIDYHAGLMTEEETHDTVRDQGVALAWLAQRLEATPQLAKIAATQSIATLTAAIANRPDDLTAGQSLGTALDIMGRGDDALRAFEAVLRMNPTRELTLRSSARTLARLQRPEQSRSTMVTTVAVNPWRSDYRLALAQYCAQAQDWSAAVAACREAIGLNPELSQARALLVECHLRSNELAKADAEFQALIRFYPASSEVWQKWYADQKQAAQTSIDFSTKAAP